MRPEYEFSEEEKQKLAGGYTPEGQASKKPPHRPDSALAKTPKGLHTQIQKAINGLEKYTKEIETVCEHISKKNTAAVAASAKASQRSGMAHRKQKAIAEKALDEVKIRLTEVQNASSKVKQILDEAQSMIAEAKQFGEHTEEITDKEQLMAITAEILEKRDHLFQLTQECRSVEDSLVHCRRPQDGDSMLNHLLHLRILGTVTEAFQNLDRTKFTMIISAKSNVTAAENLTAEELPGNIGKSYSMEKRFALKDLFNSDELFTNVTETLYGHAQNLAYFCRNYFWGQECFIQLRFVLVKMYDDAGKLTRCSILMCTDLTRDPMDVIRLYSYRYGIESAFKELKSRFSAFFCHFWVKNLPKFNWFAAKDDPSRRPASMITDEKEQRTYLYTLRAMQMFVFCASLALGIVQCLALKEKPGGEMDQAYWRRTKSERKVSVETVLRYIRENLYDMILTDPDSLVFRALARHDSGWAGKLLHNS